MKVVTVVVAVAVAMSPGVIIFWSSQHPPVGYVKREVLTPDVRAGELFRLRIVRDVPTFCTAKVKRSIVDANGYIWEQGIKERPAVSDYIVELTVPRGAAHGRARYHAEILWTCNIWQQWYPKITVQQETYFNILPSLDQEKLEQLPAPEELKKLQEGLMIQQNAPGTAPAEWR